MQLSFKKITNYICPWTLILVVYKHSIFFFFEVHDAQKHQDIGWINIFQIINNVSILY